MNQSNGVTSEQFNAYFEDADDFIEKAQEALISLEQNFSSEDINQLFRSAHSLKSSSAAVGFEHIATLTHKLEDLFDCIRKEQLNIDKNIINISFSAFDAVANYLEFKKNSIEGEIPDYMMENIEKIEEEIKTIIFDADLKAEEAVEEVPLDINKNSNSKWKNLYFVLRVFCEDSLEVIPLRRLIILNLIKEIGIIIYSEPEIEKVYKFNAGKTDLKYEFILKTDKSESELNILLDAGDIEFIKIVNISSDYIINSENKINLSNGNLIKECFDNIKEVSNKFFNNIEDTSNEILVDKNFSELINDVFINNINTMQIHKNSIKSIKVVEDSLLFCQTLLLFHDYKIKSSQNTNILLQNRFINIICNIVDLLKDKIIFKTIQVKGKVKFDNVIYLLKQVDANLYKYVFIDISDIEILESEEIKVLMKIFKDNEDNALNICLINNGVCRKRLTNIFDAINFSEKIDMYDSELEAILGVTLSCKVDFLHI